MEEHKQLKRNLPSVDSGGSDNKELNALKMLGEIFMPWAFLMGITSN